MSRRRGPNAFWIYSTNLCFAHSVTTLVHLPEGKFASHYHPTLVCESLGLHAFREGLLWRGRKRLAREAREREAAEKKRRKVYMKDIANRV